MKPSELKNNFRLQQHAAIVATLFTNNILNYNSQTENTTLDTTKITSVRQADVIYKLIRGHFFIAELTIISAREYEGYLKQLLNYLTGVEDSQKTDEESAALAKLKGKILYQLAMCNLLILPPPDKIDLGDKDQATLSDEDPTTLSDEAPATLSDEDPTTLGDEAPGLDSALRILRYLAQNEGTKQKKAQSTIDNIVEIAVENSDLLTIDPKAKSYWLRSLALSSPLVIPVAAAIAAVILPLAISGIIILKVDPMIGLVFLGLVGFAYYNLAPFLIAAATAAVAVVPPVWLVAAAAVGVVALVTLAATYLHLRIKAKQEIKTSLFEKASSKESSNIPREKQALICKQALQKLVVFQRGKIHKDSNSFLSSKKLGVKPQAV